MDSFRYLRREGRLPNDQVRFYSGVPHRHSILKPHYTTFDKVIKPDHNTQLLRPRGHQRIRAFVHRTHLGLGHTKRLHT